MIKGFWNGENTAAFVGVTYEVTKSEGEFHWQNLHVGKRRQGLRITYVGEVWIIDNEHGDGYFKVTDGQGSPSCGHKSIFNPINIFEIPDADINKRFNLEPFCKESNEHDEFIKEKDPAQFKKLQSLRAMIQKSPLL